MAYADEQGRVWSEPGDKASDMLFAAVEHLQAGEGDPVARGNRMKRAFDRMMRQRNPPSAEAMERMSLTASFEEAMAPAKDRALETWRLLSAAGRKLEELGMANAQEPRANTWSIEFQNGITISGVMYGDEPLSVSYQPVGDDVWHGNEGGLGMRQDRALDVQMRGAHITTMTVDAEKQPWSVITEFLLGFHKLFPDVQIAIDNGHTERAAAKEGEYQATKAMLERKREEEAKAAEVQSVEEQAEAAVSHYSTAHERLEQRVAALEDLTRELLDRCTTERVHLRDGATPQQSLSRSTPKMEGRTCGETIQLLEQREKRNLERQGHLEHLLYQCAQREAAQETCDTCGEPHGTTAGCEECDEAVGEILHYTYYPEQRGPRQPVMAKGG